MIEYNLKNMRVWSRLGPSGALGIAAMELAEINDKVLMLTSDLCFFSGLERFEKEYPDRIYNFGIAEQNMVGAAGGLAKEGFVPFANSYASFCCSRCADQVRVNMSYMKLPIKLVGLTAGFAAGILGATHIAVEDIAVMRALPSMVVLSPADGTEIIKCMLAAAKTKEPTYIRLTGTADLPIVYQKDYNYQIGKAIELKQGSDICFIATGSMVFSSLKAAELLEEKGISSSVINMHTLKPLDCETVDQAAKRHKLIVTVEEHNIVGGLGAAVAEYLAEKKEHVPQLFLGIKDKFPSAGSYTYQIEQAELSVEQISKKVLEKYISVSGGGYKLTKIKPSAINFYPGLEAA